MKSIDVEEAIREGLSPYISNVFVRPLPAKFSTPCLLITQVGGTELNTIDTVDIVLDTRAELAAEASELLREAIARLKQIANEQSTPIRYIEVNSTGSWGTDPVRPDLNMYSARLRVTVHQTNL